MDRPLHLGLTGPFGSGCSTIITEVLEKDPFCFKGFSLSQIVKETWLERNKPKTLEQATRRELQDVGNKLRRDHNDAAILAKKTAERAKPALEDDQSVVFDSIRNIGEVEYFRQSFYDFYLIGICCYEDDRWKRVQRKYEDLNLKYAHFKADEERDQNEEGVPFFGQQVGLCLHDADLLITNDNQPMIDRFTASIANSLAEKLGNYIDIFKGKPRPPTEPESYMSLAQNASLMSRCFKRQVGAVIVDEERRSVVSLGWNNNPRPLKPCHQEFGNCYRVLHIERELRELNNCPICGHELGELTYPYTCPNPKCAQDIYKSFIRDRAMSRCTALHAEETAILDAGGRNLEGYTMYTTTFPCFGCAQKILNAGIKKIVYVESYPDLDSIALFEKVRDIQKVTLNKFEGIKARAYHRSFGPWRKAMEEAIIKKGTSVRRS